MEGEGDEDVDKTFVEDTSILDKYKAAAEIADAAVKMLTPLLVPGADIFELCKKGDDYIEEESQKVFNRKKTKKFRRGVAFPTSVSVNHIIGREIQAADLSPARSFSLIFLKIDPDLFLCHIDLRSNWFSVSTHQPFQSLVLFGLAGRGLGL